MKKVLLILACGIAAQLSYAQATPKWAGKAKKAVFSIVTYDKDNKIKNTGNGFYINENGSTTDALMCSGLPESCAICMTNSQKSNRKSAFPASVSVISAGQLTAVLQ